MEFEETVRVADKTISVDRAVRVLKKVLRLRSQGLSQQEVANRLTLDRSFVSRLEAIGEVRKGGRVAVIGFPIANKQELAAICREQGLDFIFLLTNQERWSLVGRQKALDFFNQVMEIVARLKGYDTLVLITSERWYRLAEALLDLQVIFVNLGPTPLEEDRRVEPVLFKQKLQDII
ncbi:MAG: transcriptional regulator [Firmicutes bacterium]|nr:transcriptional regulator [Bacillota bacterium]